MLGVDELVESLRICGVDHIFGLPGVHNLPIYDALRDAKGIRLVTVRDEDSAAYMAQGYFRVSGRVAVCVLAPGPGVTNALTGIAEAYTDSIPMVVLSGGIRPSAAGRGAIHDMNQLPILRPVTKWCGKAENFDDIAALFQHAFEETCSGRPRPTFLEISLDTQSSQGKHREVRRPLIPRIDADLRKIGVVADTLLNARRPVAIAGGGVLIAQASAELQALSEGLSMPVATTITAKETILDANQFSMGLLNDEVARSMVPKADVVLSVGCRFAERSTSNWSLKINGKLIQVDVDPAEIGRNYPADMEIVCDAKLFLESLQELVKGRARVGDRVFLGELEDLKAKREAKYREKLRSDAVPLKPQRVMWELSRILPQRSVITCDSGNNAWWPMMFIESKEDRRFLFPSGNVSMGFALPAALGARCVAENVVCITGDGGFMMKLAELATSLQEHLDVTVIVLNDGGFGAIRHYQRFNFGARYSGVNLLNPDFAEVAEAFGAKGIRIENPEELGTGLAKALNSKETTVLDVKIDPEEVALPDWIIQSFKQGLSKPV